MYEKHDSEPGGCMSFGQAFYGSVTVGERGQIVIPAEARQDLGVEAGDKLLVMKHPLYKGLMVFKIESVREFLDEFAEGLARVEAKAKEESD
ncbi:MAG TPA: AbrB/MazE/SpoVT family DNA-binding domain-containing protein [Fimbriimonadaceae bacterium]|nr:AbrB/MazE/SpoVT family DNA-binding domain-containing protein [Fimbriimonadaceae bacterium]